MSLSNRDLEVLLKASLDLHQERDLDTLRAEAPEIILNAVPGEYFLWLESGYTGMTDPLPKMFHWDHPARIGPKHVRHILKFVPEHPFTPHARATGDYGPMRLSDFWTDDQLRASTIWRDVYQHLGMGRMLVLATFRGKRIGVIHVCRPLKLPDFSERDRLMLRLLGPHFSLALQTAERHTAKRDGTDRPLFTLGLTARELEIASWLARGSTNPEIATILAMQTRTVEKHVERILLKLGVENRTAAAMMIAGQLSIPSRPSPGPEVPAPARAAKATRR